MSLEKPSKKKMLTMYVSHWVFDGGDILWPKQYEVIINDY